jgi:hypothetical protein
MMKGVRCRRKKPWLILKNYYITLCLRGIRDTMKNCQDGQITESYHYLLNKRQRVLKGYVWYLAHGNAHINELIKTQLSPGILGKG